MQQNKTSLV